MVSYLNQIQKKFLNKTKTGTSQHIQEPQFLLWKVLWIFLVGFYFSFRFYLFLPLSFTLPNPHPTFHPAPPSERPEYQLRVYHLFGLFLVRLVIIDDIHFLLKIMCMYVVLCRGIEFS